MLVELVLDGYGAHLGARELNFVVESKGRVSENHPFHSVESIRIDSGNHVSAKALAWASIYGIKVLVTSQSGRPLGVYLPLNYDMHVGTRVKQYETHNTEKGVRIAKAIVKTKIETQSTLLDKYGIDDNSIKSKAMNQINDLKAEKVGQIRAKLQSIEGHFGKFYFNKIVNLFPDNLKIRSRQDHKAADATNNLLNLGYEVLKWEVYKSILEAHLDPYLGFLHSIQHAKPSLVCDLQEPYRPIIDGFLIEYCQKLREKDLQPKYEDGKPRIFLKYPESSKLIGAVNTCLGSRVEKQRTRKYGSYSEIKTVIREDTEQLARYIRGELPTWEPTSLCMNIGSSFNDKVQSPSRLPSLRDRIIQPLSPNQP
ncbi:CRISPR-associated endonuclease Cas1 [Candidatus Bathyarchaeota archaeon]|nr:CRISPR-associated endonuclease Cas1 [Candidatus Bathyarchaeota archaeon]